MTLSLAKKLYAYAVRPQTTAHTDDEWSAIHHAMQTIVAAESNLDAAKSIDWWDCWYDKYTSIAFATKVRSIHGKWNCEK